MGAAERYAVLLHQKIRHIRQYGVIHAGCKFHPVVVEGDVLQGSDGQFQHSGDLFHRIPEWGHTFKKVPAMTIAGSLQAHCNIQISAGQVGGFALYVFD